MRLLWIVVALGSLGLSIGTQTRAQGLSVGDSVASPRVVFVCEHGTVKSLVAKEYFNREAKVGGLAYRAIARGTVPEPTVPTAVSDGLRKDGFDVSAFAPRKIEASDADRASLIVS